MPATARRFRSATAARSVRACHRRQPSRQRRRRSRREHRGVTTVRRRHGSREASDSGRYVPAIASSSDPRRGASGHAAAKIARASASPSRSAASATCWTRVMALERRASQASDSEGRNCSTSHTPRSPRPRSHRRRRSGPATRVRPPPAGPRPPGWPRGCRRGQPCSSSLTPPYACHRPVRASRHSRDIVHGSIGHSCRAEMQVRGPSWPSRRSRVYSGGRASLCPQGGRATLAAAARSPRTDTGHDEPGLWLACGPGSCSSRSARAMSGACQVAGMPSIVCTVGARPDRPCTTPRCRLDRSNPLHAAWAGRGRPTS